MVSKADVKTGVVTDEVVSPAVITGVDISSILPVEGTEGVVPAEVVPSTVFSIDVVPSVVISAEGVVGVILVSKADVKTGVFMVEVGGPAVVITRVDVFNSPVELIEDDISA